MSDDSEVQVKFGAQTDGFASGIQKATAEMRRTQAAFTETAASARQADDALGKLVSRLDPAYKAQKNLADATILLDRNLQAGNISAATHAQMLQRIQGAYGTAESGAKGLSFATAGVSRELIVMGHEAMTGNWSRMPGTMMVLMERTGNLGAVMASLASPIGIATLAVGGLTAAMVYAIAKSTQLESQMQSLRDNMTATGRSGTFTREQFDALVKTLHDVGGLSNKAAGEIVEVFVRAHKIGAPLMQDLTNIVVKYSNATGKDAVDAAKELAKAFADPEKGAKALREELGQFLTPAQNALIESQERSGQVAKAQATLFAALRDRLREVSEEAKRTTLSLMMEGLGKAGGRIADDAGTDRMDEEMAEAVEAKRKAAIEERARVEQSAAAQAQKAVNEALEASGKYLPLGERRKALGEEIRRTEEAITQAKAAGIAADDAGLQKLTGRLAEQKRSLADMKGKGDASPVEAMKKQLQDLHAAQDDEMNQDKRLDVQFWESKISGARQGSAVRVAIEREFAAAKRALAKQELDEDVASIKKEGAQFREGSLERVIYATQEANRIGATYHYQGKEYEAALERQAVAERQFADRKTKLAAEELDRAIKLAHEKTEVEVQRLELEEAKGNITVAQKLAATQRLHQQEIQFERELLDKKLALYQKDTDEYKKALDQRKALDAKADKQILKDQTDTAKHTNQVWSQTFGGVGTSMQSAVAGMIMGTTKMRAAMQQIAGSIVQSFVKAGADMLADWLMKTALMKAAKAAMAAFFAGEDTAIAASGGEAALEQAAETIPVYAGEGAAGAYEALVSIPYVGPFIAPVAAATAFSAIMGYMPSAAGGWEVPRDTLAMVHEQEMILPANISNHIRASMNAGGAGANQGGGDTHNHYYSISAIDGDSVKKFFRNHRGAMSGQIQTSVRDHGLRMPK